MEPRPSRSLLLLLLSPSAPKPLLLKLYHSRGPRQCMVVPWAAAGPWAASIATAWLSRCPACPEARVTCGACPACPAAAAAAPCPGCPSCPDCSLTCGSGPGWWAVLAALVAGLAAGGGLRVTLGWAARVASLFVGGTDPPPVTLLVEDDGAGQDGGAHRRFRAVRA